MKVVLHSMIAMPSLISRYRYAAQQLREAGIESLIRTGVAPGVDANPGDSLISHNSISDEERERLDHRCFGGKELSRPEHLNLLAALGFPTMEWTTVANLNEALALLETWGVDFLILKRSHTGAGRGFHVLTADQPNYMTWNFAKDVICKEVNPNCGRVFKAELFGGKLMLGFVLKKEPLGTRLIADDPCPTGARQLALYRDDNVRPDDRHRELWEFSAAEKEALEDLSLALTAQGLGYVSLDLMRKPDGQLVAIELNTGNVTTWWSEQFPILRERFAATLLNLVQQN